MNGSSQKNADSRTLRIRLPRSEAEVMTVAAVDAGKASYV